MLGIIAEEEPNANKEGDAANYADESGLHDILAVDALKEAPRGQCVEVHKGRGPIRGFSIDFRIERPEIERVANRV